MVWYILSASLVSLPFALKTKLPTRFSITAYAPRSAATMGGVKGAKSAADPPVEPVPNIARPIRVTAVAWLKSDVPLVL